MERRIQYEIKSHLVLFFHAPVQVYNYIKQRYFLKLTGLHGIIKILKQTQYCSLAQRVNIHCVSYGNFDKILYMQTRHFYSVQYVYVPIGVGCLVYCDKISYIQGLKLLLNGCQCDQTLSVGNQILRTALQWASHLFLSQLLTSKEN